MSTGKRPAHVERIALIGAGDIARSCHLPCLLSRNVNLACVMDPNPNALGAVRRLVRPETRLSQSASLADLPEVDAAIVCTPISQHYGQVKHLLERGIHVLCEKPLAAAPEKDLSLCEIAAAVGVTLQVGYYRRFHPTSWAVGMLLREPSELGDLTRCTIRAGHMMPSSPRWMEDREVSRGGVMMDFGVHIVDRLLSWFDDVCLDGYADDSHGGVEANAAATIRATCRGRQIPVDLLLSRTSNIGYLIRLDFERGSIVNNLNNGYVLDFVSADDVAFLGRRIRASCSVEVASPATALDYFGDQWAEFIARTDGGPEVRSSLPDAVRTSAFVEQCYVGRRPLVLPWGY